MNQRRMFSPKIVGSDAFLEMPVSARELYFQLGMYADDDGFINPKKIIRMIGAADDDLKMLIAKRFVLPFANGVVVIKHWLINNLVRKDFYRETIYLDEKESLQIKENRAYTENVNKLLTDCEHRIDKDRIVYSKSKDLPYTNLEELKYEPLKGIKTKKAFLDRARERAGKPKMLKTNPKVWEVINKYRRQYQYAIGKTPLVSDSDYFHIERVSKKLPPEDMDAMIVWYVKPDNKKFKDHPNLKSIFTVENINKFNLQK